MCETRAPRLTVIVGAKLPLNAHQEITQHLVFALAVILVAGLAEKRAEFVRAKRQAHLIEHF